MSDWRRNALADKIKKYDEAKKLVSQWEGAPFAFVEERALMNKATAFVREYVLVLTRDGQVAPYLGMNFADEVLTLVLGSDLRARLPDLNLHELVKVVQEIPAGEGAK